jgi:hypothetical protein
MLNLINTKTMELIKLSKAALLLKCDELNIKKCKTKTKGELISLINSTNNNIEFIIEEETYKCGYSDEGNVYSSRHKFSGVKIKNTKQN